MNFINYSFLIFYSQKCVDSSCEYIYIYIERERERERDRDRDRDREKNIKTFLGQKTQKLDVVKKSI